MHPEIFATSAGADLCVQTAGDPTHPAMLLLAGTSCSMDWWPPELCERLAAGGWFVVRYDQRDTGTSTFDPPGEPSYGLPDLLDDAVAVLDELDIEAARWVGFSQGGWVAQLAALNRPERVDSLVLVSTRPTGHGPADADLPGLTDRLIASWDSIQEPNWADPRSVVEHLVEGDRTLAGEEFDEPAARGIATTCVGRAAQVLSAITNHPMASQGPRWRERLAEVVAPTLVVHGDADPLFPVANAVALADQIPGADLRLLSGVGHELPPRVWAEAIEIFTGPREAPNTSSAR